MSLADKLQDSIQEARDQIARKAMITFIKDNPNTMVGDLLSAIKDDDGLTTAFSCLDLRDIATAINGTAAQSSEAAGVPGPSRKRGVTSANIVKFVKANPGCSRGDVMKGVGLKGGTVSSQLRTLRTAGRLKGEGPDRDMKYYVV